MDEAGDITASGPRVPARAAQVGEPANAPDPVAGATVDREIHVRLASAALLLVAVMVLPILTSFTTVLNGFVGGVGVGWIAGFAEFVIALSGAIAYCAWADRRSDGPPPRTAAPEARPVSGPGEAAR